MKKKPVPNTNEIGLYLHCALCLGELAEKGKVAIEGETILSPAEYQMIEAGWTPLGLQVRCRRHKRNIIHIDFQGQKHPANTSREDPSTPDPKKL